MSWWFSLREKNLLNGPPSSFTEPIILGLIIANVVVLAIQAAPALNTPREDDGYFQSWEDGVLLILFLIFTLVVR